MGDRPDEWQPNEIGPRLSGKGNDFLNDPLRRSFEKKVLWQPRHLCNTPAETRDALFARHSKRVAADALERSVIMPAQKTD
jgi:hypothetical protein